ncbi:hypothetical protein [Brevundimonas sp. GCM10030266]|jgi:hypothetical protein|uniref:hypothetical protein n=1 Tax=Brevundimonas sp. GCM10030266 TaxID=3273386 RepID=UPI0036217491
MIRKLAFTAAALASLSMAAPSFAQTFSPSSGPLSGNGNVDLQQTATLNCDVDVDVASMGATSAAISFRDIYAGDFLCFVVAPYGAWSLATVPGSTDKIALTIGANTIANKPCYDTIIVDWDNVAKEITFNNNVLDPVTPGNPSCTILSGVISIPGLSIL